MTNANEPKDGDFTSYLDDIAVHVGGTRSQENPDIGENDPNDVPLAAAGATGHTISDVLAGRSALTEELLAQLGEIENSPPLSDEELERQALSDPGADGDAGTPE